MISVIYIQKNIDYFFCWTMKVPPVVSVCWSCCLEECWPPQGKYAGHVTSSGWAPGSARDPVSKISHWTHCQKCREQLLLTEFHFLGSSVQLDFAQYDFKKGLRICSYTFTVYPHTITVCQQEYESPHKNRACHGWCAGTEAKHLLHLFQPWQAQFLCGNSDNFLDLQRRTPQTLWKI